MPKRKNSVGLTKNSVSGGNQKMVVNQIIIKPPVRKTSDASTWRNALASADMGRVKMLFDLYEDMLIDGVLSDAIDKRIKAVLNSELTFQDAEGKEVEEIAILMDTPDWEELLTSIMEVKFWGRSGVEFDFSEYFDVRPIPKKHIKLETRQILLNEYDDSGISYENDDHILILGKQRDFGLMLKTAPLAIYKRGGFGDYAQWLEIFGMPQRIGKYSSYDPESRKLLEQALEQSGSAPWVVIPKESEVETTNNTGNGNSGVSYNDFRKACNEEMLITILGQTMTTVQGEKGARSLGEVHKEVEEGKNQSDMRFVQKILNHFVLPILEKRGFPVSGGYFVFPKSAEALTVDNIVSLSEILDIPVSFLHEKYSIPVPKNGEAVAKKAGGQQIDAQKMKPDKPIKNSDGFIKQLQDFFVNAPLRIRGAIRTVFLSSNEQKITNLIDVQTLFKRAVKDIYRRKGETGNDAKINENLFKLTNDVLQHASKSTFAEAGAEWGKTHGDFVNAFMDNTAIYSAFKAHEQTAEIIKLLYRDDGSVRSFSQFKKEALLHWDGKVGKKIWIQRLQTEYNTATRSARMAANWKKFQATKNIYPNLEYMPSRSANPRDSHRVYWNKIWAIDDPIWDRIMPPSDWNCFCGVRATDKPVTVFDADWIMPVTDPVFENNPGKTAKIINTEETSYYKNAPEQNRPLIILFGMAIRKRDEEIIEKYIGKNGGYLNIVKQNKEEFVKNKTTYKILADDGGQYSMLKEKKVDGKSNPDALNIISGEYSDAKHPISSSGKRAIQNSINSAVDQKIVSEVVIRFSEQYSLRTVYKGLIASFQPGKAKKIKTVVIIEKSGKINRIEVAKLRKRIINNIRR